MHPILTDNERKAELSYAYLAALAAKAGWTLQRGPWPDTASIDATVRTGYPSDAAFDIQLKATARARKSSAGLHFRLKRKNYNDLAGSRAVPLLLIVLELPGDESQWLECTPERLVMRKCGWWMSLAGRTPLDAGSKTVTIPHSQRIGESGLAPLVAMVPTEVS